MWSNLGCQGKPFLSWVRGQYAGGRLRSVGKGRGRISGETFSSPGKLDGRPGSLPFIQPIPSQVLVPSTSSLAPVFCVKGLVHPWFFSPVNSEASSHGLGRFMFSCVYARPPHRCLYPRWPSLAWLLFFPNFWDAPSAPAQKPDTETQLALTPSQRGRFAGEGTLNRLFQPEAKSIRLICCMVFWRESRLVLPDVKWPSVAV